MKKIINICILLCCIIGSKAQVTITLNVQPQPPANFNSWSQRNEVITLVAAGSAQGNTLAVKINTTLETADGSPVAKTDITRAAVRQLPASGSSVFYAKDILDAGSLVFNPTYQNQLNQTGKLKAGTYKLTVSFFNAAGTAQISNEQVKIFTIVAAQLPVLISPANEAILKEEAAQTAIVFRWTPLLPRPREPVSYIVLVFEILEGQTPMQALRSNQPILNTEVKGATQYVWRPQLGLAQEGRNAFIWTIRSTDFKGVPITGESTNGDAVSEPYTFSFRKVLDGTVKGIFKTVVPKSNDSKISGNVVVIINNKGKYMEDGTPILEHSTITGNVSNVKDGTIIKTVHAISNLVLTSATDEVGNFSLCCAADCISMIYLDNLEYGKIKVLLSNKNGDIKRTNLKK